MSQSGRSSRELADLESALVCETKQVNIRLREGEYQFSLAKAIASFELEWHFPDAKDLVKKLFGEKRAEDAQFVSKIQTILKKMEKSGIVRILPKEKPWELQKYVLSSFSFQDVDRNQVVFATKADVEKTLELIRSRSNLEHAASSRTSRMTMRLSLLAIVIVVSFVAVLWTLAQPVVNLIIFISAFCIAAASSTALGISIARRSNE